MDNSSVWWRNYFHIKDIRSGEKEELFLKHFEFCWDNRTNSKYIHIWSVLKVIFSLNKWMPKLKCQSWTDIENIKKLFFRARARANQAIILNCSCSTWFKDKSQNFPTIISFSVFPASGHCRYTFSSLDFWSKFKLPTYYLVVLVW